MKNINIFFKRLIVTITGIGIIAFSTFYISTLMPSQINLEKKIVQLNGIEIIGRANNLIIQSITTKGIWASRGYDIYFKPHNKNTFNRIDRVPVPVGMSYLANSSLVRLLFNKEEVLELMVHPDGHVIAFAGGYVFLKDTNNNNFRIVLNMEHFGLSKGRGIMPQGYTFDERGNMYWGEYWRNPDKKPVKLWKSTNRGLDWDPVYIFPENTIRHIHAVQYDPFFKAIWMATGDKSNQCKIMYSKDGGSSFITIGTGSQQWKTVSLIFDENYVYWGTDGTSKEFPDVLLCRWNRKTKTTETLVKLDSFAFYSASLKNGIHVITTDDSNGPASIWITKNGTDWIQSANWKRNRKSHFGTIRIKSGLNYFIISNVNLKSYNNDLLLIRPNPDIKHPS